MNLRTSRVASCLYSCLSNVGYTVMLNIHHRLLQRSPIISKVHHQHLYPPLNNAQPLGSNKAPSPTSTLPSPLYYHPPPSDSTPQSPPSPTTPPQPPILNTQHLPSTTSLPLQYPFPRKHTHRPIHQLPRAPHLHYQLSSISRKCTPSLEKALYFSKRHSLSRKCTLFLDQALPFFTAH